MFVGVSASGLMATAQPGPIAEDYRLSETTIMGANTLSVALVVDNVLNGFARPFFGGLSDRIGREGTMALAFTLGGVSYWLQAMAGHNPWGFVTCAGLIFFTWGEIFSLFPSTCTDTCGPKYATANASLLYTAKGTAVFLVPVANVVKSATGSWDVIFLFAAVTNVSVVLLALFVLRPIRPTGYGERGSPRSDRTRPPQSEVFGFGSGSSAAAAAATGPDGRLTGGRTCATRRSHDLRGTLRARQSVRRLPGAWSERRCLVVDRQCRILLGRAGEHRQRRG
jgi:MFS family permease